MKYLASLAVALTLVPGLAAAACYDSHTAQISCADGQTYDAETRSCVPTTS